MEKRKVAEMNEVRTSLYNTVVATDFEGHAFKGMGAEGAIFVNADGNYAVVKVIAKSADFDADLAIEEFEARAKVAAIKETERLAKKAEKEEKAKKRAEEKAAKEAAKATEPTPE